MTDLIKMLMVISGFINMFSSIMWNLTGDSDPWLWFSRWTAAMIFFGIAGIINAIQDNNKKLEE